MARAAAVVLACVVLAGCAAGTDSAGGNSDTGGGTSQATDGTETFDTPETEATTPDSSQGSSSRSNPAISVARLPIGGDSQDDDTDPRLQCAHVTWIASKDGQIPRGTGVEITGVVFDPPAFKAVREGCGSDRPSCLHYVFRTSTLQCDLAVRATGDVAEDANPSLAFTGLAFCPDNASDSCRRLVAALEGEQQLSVSLNVPQLPTETGDTSTDGTDTSTDGSTDSSTTDGG